MPLIQKGIKKNCQHIRRVIGSHPIIQFFIEKMNVAQILSACIKQDERLNIPLEKSLTVLIHNILTASNPMYEISDWSNKMDEESIGLENGDAEFINDDRIGSSLATFYDGKNKDFFFRLALRTIKVFELNCSNIHQDTTSITFSGKYDSQEAYEKICFGKNKDHRPDLKQLVLGMSVTGDGFIPLAHKIYSGNQTDDTLHIDNYRRIRNLLQKTDFIYVADSKLATDKNLRNIDSYDGKFICIMPKTWAEDKEFKELLKINQVKWRPLLSRKNNRSPNNKIDRYELAQGEYCSKQGYRLIWIRSSQKKELDIEVRIRHIEKSLKELNSLRLKLNKRKFRDKSNIDQEVQEILKSNNCVDLINYEITSKREYKNKMKKPGRPSAGDLKNLIWKEIYFLSFIINEILIAEDELTDGVFPLISNLPDSKGAKEILSIYKNQAFLEKRHCNIKTWQRITPVLLKNTKRVLAYVHMHVVALTVASLIERTLRNAMASKKIENILIYPENRICPYPTFYDIDRLFKDVEKYEVYQGDNFLYFPAKLSKTQKQILNLLEVPVSLYQ